MRLYTFCLIAFVAFTLSCKKPREANPIVDPGVIEQYRPAATPLADKLDRLTKTAAAAPPLTQDVLKLPLDGANFVNDPAAPQASAVFFEVERLVSKAARDYDFEFSEYTDFREPITWLRTGKVESGWAPGVNDVHRAFKRFVAVRYVVVLRKRERVAPSAKGSSFSPGVYRGEALAYDLSPSEPKYLGGFRFGATNSDSVNVRFTAKQGDSEKNSWLLHDLKYRTYINLHDMLLARAPGAKLPSTDQYKSTLN